jgi:hypothetical protein
LGSAGCAIGANQIFGFQTKNGLAGAIPISPADITITPTGSTFDPGIIATTNASAAAGVQLEALFSYRISGNTYTGSSISLAGSSASGDGAVTDVQNFCAGGIFEPDGISNCTGSPGSLVLLNSGNDSATFAAVSSISVIDDLTFDGGTRGSAVGGTVTDRFTAVPEPFTFLLSAMGLALAFGLKLTKRIL